MKINCLLFAFFLLLAASGSRAQSFSVASFNLRYDNPRDTGNLWVDRKAVVADLIRFHDFDVFGTQEGLKNQLDDLSRSLPQYARYGVGRTDGKEAGEFSAIFYKAEKYIMLNKGDFWLSQTPDRPSLGWDAVCCNRICSWVQLQDRSGRKFYVFNVHYDHQGTKARLESSKLMLQKIREIAGDQPVVVTGDFNGDHHSEWYKALAESKILTDTYRKVETPYLNTPSFNGFGKNVSGRAVIDHIFVSKHFAPMKWGVLSDTYNGKFPSDHCPVVVRIEWNQG